MGAEKERLRERENEILVRTLVSLYVGGEEEEEAACR